MTNFIPKISVNVVERMQDLVNQINQQGECRSLQITAKMVAVEHTSKEGVNGYYLGMIMSKVGSQIYMEPCKDPMGNMMLRVRYENHRGPQTVNRYVDDKHLVLKLIELVCATVPKYNNIRPAKAFA